MDHTDSHDPKVSTYNHGDYASGETFLADDPPAPAGPEVAA